MTCLVVAAGVAAFFLINAKNAAAQQKAKAAALAQMGTYTDYSAGISFQVPTSWEQIPLDNALDALSGMGNLGVLPSAFVAFGDGSPVTGGTGPGSFMIFATQDYPSGAPMDVKKTLEQGVAQIENAAFDGLSIEGGVEEIKGVGLSGAEVTMSVDGGGRTVFMRLCFLDSGSCFYMFMFGADDYTWEKSRYFFDGTVESFSLVDTH